MSSAAEAYLHNLPRFADKGARAYKPGLDRMRRLLRQMGRPDQGFTCVHVGGTNGKGSTASMVAAILTHSGLRTGLHTSPHLLHVTERMRIDGVAAHPDWLWDAVDRHRNLFDEVQPSFFEATVALSLLYFRENGVDAAVIEVGLGGRLDATNVIEPAVSVITNISLEHTDILGSTVEEIAREKAGIIKNAVPVVVGVSQPEALETVSCVSAAHNARLIHVREAGIKRSRQEDDEHSFRLATPLHEYGEIVLDVSGDHQMVNAILAVLAVEQVVDNPRPDVVKEALSSVRRLSGLRGRLEIVRNDPPVIVDVAHNADGLDAALTFARRVARERPIDLVLALMQDKDLDAVAEVISRHGARVHLVPMASDRAFRPDDLRELLAARSVSTRTWEDIGSVLRSHEHEESVLLVAGSHLIAADALRELPVD